MKTTVVATAGVLVLLAAPAAQAAGPAPTLVSVSGTERVGRGLSVDGRLSADGRYIAFTTTSNLGTGDTGRADVYLRDRQAGTTRRMSLHAPQSTRRDSARPDISADGRYVVYDAISYDSSGVGSYDVYRTDVQARRTVLVSTAGGPLDSRQNTAARVSGDGHLVAYSAYGRGVVVRDVRAGTATRVDVSSAGVPGNDPYSRVTDLSPDGRYVVFSSGATDLVPGDTNGVSDVFVRDRTAGTTSRVDTTSTGAQATNQFGGGTTSADGRYVAFGARSDDLVPGRPDDDAYVVVKDRVTGAVRVVSDPVRGAAGFCSGAPQLSDDGRSVAFACNDGALVPGDTNGVYDVFVRDLVSGTVTRVGRPGAATGQPEAIESPALSADGSVVTFRTHAALVAEDTNVMDDVYAIDR